MNADEAIDSIDLLVNADVKDALAEFIRAQSARIAELQSFNRVQLNAFLIEQTKRQEIEESARWRTCKDEPPSVKQSTVLFRWDEKKLYSVGYMNDAGSIVTLRPAYGVGDPDEWRPIT